MHAHSHTVSVAPATVTRHFSVPSSLRTFSGSYCMHLTRIGSPLFPYTVTRRAEPFTRNRTCNRPHSPPLCTAAVGMRVLSSPTAVPLLHNPSHPLRPGVVSLMPSHALFSASTAPTLSCTRTPPSHPQSHPSVPQRAREEVMDEEEVAATRRRFDFSYVGPQCRSCMHPLPMVCCQYALCYVRWFGPSRHFACDDSREETRSCVVEVASFHVWLQTICPPFDIEPCYNVKVTSFHMLFQTTYPLSYEEPCSIMCAYI